jgi:hypothetical protein
LADHAPSRATLALLGALLLTLIPVSPAAAAPPANDDSATATVATEFGFSDRINTAEATTAADDPTSCLATNARSVWYRFTPPRDGRVSANTFGSFYDTVLAVFAHGSSGNLVACNADTQKGGQSRVSFIGGSGVPYYFMVASETGSGGDLTFTIEVAQNRVVATTKRELLPAGAPGYLSWTQSDGDAYNAYAKPDGRSKFRVNAAGTAGWNGGIDGTRLVYQQVSSRGQSDIKFYNLETRRRTNAPGFINTSLWEWGPSLSGNRLLLGRNNFQTGRWEILLYDLATGSGRILDSIQKTRGNYIQPGQVSGSYAVWEKWASDDGDVYIYDIVAETTRKLSDTQWEFAPSVTADGTVYFGRGAAACGASVKVVRLPLGQHPAAVAALPGGQDFGDSFTYTDGEGAAHVLFDRSNCRNAQDIYKLVDPS